MAEETEVKNVGGDNGVASEVTLAKLVTAMEKIAAKTGADPKSQAAKAEKARTESISQGIKVSTKHRDAVKKNTDAVNLSTKAFKSLSSGLVKITAMLSGAVFESLTGFTKELFGASKNLSNFVRHIPLIGGRLSQLTGLIDESYDTFQQLAKSGAAFDYNLIELRNTAASTRVSLSEFAGMVTENSEKLAMFGGTVDQGVKRIANLRDTMGSKLTERFEKLGLTTEEINEALIYQQYLNRAGARTETRNANEQALAAASLTKNMLTLAKLTGEDIKTQQDKIAQAQMDVAFQRERAKLEPKEQEKLNAAMSEAQAAGGDAAVEVLKAKFLGMPPLTEAAQLYTATQTEGAELIKKNLDKALNSAVDYDQFMLNREDRMSEYGEAYARAANRLDGIIKAEAAGLEGPGIAEQMMASQKLFGTYIDDSGRFVKKEFQKTFEGLGDEDDAGTGLDGAARFRTALDNARRALTENIISPLQGVAADVLDPLTESFKKFIGEDGASTVFQKSLDNLRVFLDETVTPKIEDFFEAFAEDPKQAIEDAFSDISTAMTNWFLGDLEDGERSGGFYDKHLAPILQRLGTDLMQGAWGVIKDGLTGLFTKPEVIAGTVTAIGLLFGASVVKTALANALTNRIAGGGYGSGGGSGGGSGEGGKGKRFRIPKFLKGAGVLTALLGAAELASIRTDDTLTDDEKTQQTSESLGGTGGALTGAAAGALAGSFVPIVGTGIGGLIGGTLGYFGGSYAGGEIGERLTAPSNPSSNPPLSASDIRSEMIDPNDPDPLLAREARAQRARFADSMDENYSVNNTSKKSTQDQSSAAINDLNTTMQELRQTLNDIKANTKKQVEATENIGTV